MLMVPPVRKPNVSNNHTFNHTLLPKTRVVRWTASTALIDNHPYLKHFVVQSMFEHVQSVVATASVVVERHCSGRAFELHLFTVNILHTVEVRHGVLYTALKPQRRYTTTPDCAHHRHCTKRLGFSLLVYRHWYVGLLYLLMCVCPSVPVTNK